MDITEFTEEDFELVRESMLDALDFLEDMPGITVEGDDVHLVLHFDRTEENICLQGDSLNVFLHGLIRGMDAGASDATLQHYVMQYAPLPAI